MPFIETSIPDLKIFDPKVFGDHRGYFMESYNKRTFEAAGINCEFVQDNRSKSLRGVLRGLHYQIGEHAQAKLVTVLQGEVLDVVVDIRENSPTYGQHYSILLTAENKRQLFVPRGFAHGFVVLSETAVFFYKCDNFYNKAGEGGISFNCPTLNIDWRIDSALVQLSDKDQVLPNFGEHLSSEIAF